MIAAPLILLIIFMRSELVWPALESPVEPRLFRKQIGPIFSWLAGGITILLSILSVGLPLFDLLSVKRTWTELPAAFAANHTATWNSFSFAATTAFIIAGLGLLRTAFRPGKSARANFRGKPAWRHRLQSLLWLPLLVPGVIIGLVLIFVLNRSWSGFFYQSTGIVIFAFVLRYFALGWHGLAQASRSVDRDLTDDAQLNGANRWQLLRFVQWPQMAPQVMAASYVIFLLCLWDVESMILVWPPGGETLALSIFNLLHYGHNAQVNALCLVLLGVAATPLVVWTLLKGVTALQRSGVFLQKSSLILCAALLVTSCSPKQAANETELNSRIFTRVQIIGHRGVGVGELNKPRSVALDKQDNFYVIDMTGRVQKFSSRGSFLLSWQLPQTDLGNPKGMGRDANGNIIVVEPHYQRVNHFTTDGALLLRWGMKGTNAGEFMMPRAVAVNSRGDIYISEYGGSERVQRFRISNSSDHPSSNLVRSETINGIKMSVEFLDGFGRPGTEPGNFNRPEGLCIDSKDQLYVADSCNHRIQIFSRDGKFIRAYGKPGTGKGELSYPYDICVDSAGRQYVCEFGNSRIQIFDAEDRPLEIIGGPGSEPGRFNNPWGVALDSEENLYVADSQNHRVQKLLRNLKSEPKQSVAAAPAKILNFRSVLGVCNP